MCACKHYCLVLWTGIVKLLVRSRYRLCRINTDDIIELVCSSFSFAICASSICEYKLNPIVVQALLPLYINFIIAGDMPVARQKKPQPSHNNLT